MEEKVVPLKVKGHYFCIQNQYMLHQCCESTHMYSVFIKAVFGSGPFLTSPLALGVNLAPRGEICPLGEKFTPFFTPRGEHFIV
jgi:hypothetical protein